MSLENVKAFYERLANDETFRYQIQNVSSKSEGSQIINDAGYDFTHKEFEEYTTQLLESNAAEGELKNLDEKELEAIFGGAIFRASQYIQQVYGTVFRPRPSGPIWV